MADAAVPSKKPLQFGRFCLAFNETFLGFLKKLLVTFTPCRPYALLKEYTKLQQLCVQDKQTPELFHMFKTEVMEKSITALLRKKKMKAKEEFLVVSPLFIRIDMKRLYDGFKKKEKRRFWKNLKKVTSYFSMMQTCSGCLAPVGDMTARYIEQHKGKLSEEEMRTKVLGDIFSGKCPEVSKEICNIVTNPEKMGEIMEGVSGMMGSENMFASLMSRVPKGDMKEMKKSLKNMSSLKQMMDVAKQSMGMGEEKESEESGEEEDSEEEEEEESEEEEEEEESEEEEDESESEEEENGVNTE